MIIGLLVGIPLGGTLMLLIVAALASAIEDIKPEEVLFAPGCERCELFDEIHGPQCPLHPDHDPTPWCSGCGARRKRDCHCGPIASSN